MSSPLVSIIIPTYNAARWIGETLESAFAQTWNPIEVILVDDGCTDGSVDIARRYESRGLRIISQRNAGLSAARNAGMRQARGDYLQFLDADDLLSPDKIEHQVRAAAEVTSRTLLISPWAKFKLDLALARPSASPLGKDSTPVDYLKLAFRTNAVVPVHTWLTPRAVAESAGFFNENVRVTEDVEYYTRAVLASDGIRFASEGCSYYRTFHTASLSRFRDRAAFESLLRAAQEIEATVMRSGIPELRQACADYYRHISLRIPSSYGDLQREAEHRVQALGGSDVTPLLGRRGQMLARLIGWRAVQWLRVRLWALGIYPGKRDFISE